MWDKFINLITPQFGPDLYTQYGDWVIIWVPYAVWYLKKLLGLYLLVVIFIAVFRKCQSKKHLAYGTISILLLLAIEYYFKWLAGYPEGPKWPIDLYLAYLGFSSALLYASAYHIGRSIDICVCRDE